MKASISFDFKEMKEHIKFGKKDINSNICSTFLDILSIDTDYINNEIIKKIDFSNPDNIKNAYKKVYKIQPLLFIDEFDFIKHLNDFKNPQKTILDFAESINSLRNSSEAKSNLNFILLVGKLSKNLLSLNLNLA